MNTGMYLNSFVCLLIFISGFYTCYFIYRNSNGSGLDISYAGFWLLASLLWLFYSISLFIFKLGYISQSLFINQYIVQTFGFLQIVATSFYAFYRLTKNQKITSVAFGFCLLLSVVALYFNYLPGSVSVMRTTYFSFDYTINETYFEIFQILFAIIVIITAIDFIKNLFLWFKQSAKFEQKYFFTSLSLMIYGMIGYFEESSAIATSISLFFRIAIILCIYIAYLAYSDKELYYE